MENGGGISYTIPNETNLKEYYIKGEYSDPNLGTRKVIAPVEGTSGNDRFYVISLEDFNSGTSYCYFAGFKYLYLDVTPEGEDFGKGEKNTQDMMNLWKRETGYQNMGNWDDIFGAMQTEYNNGWFIPSKSELAALSNELNVTESTYNELGLNYGYWSSSSYSSTRTYYARFVFGQMSNITNDADLHVRLAKKF